MNDLEIDKLLDDFISEERSMKVVPFMTTGLMSRIENTRIEKVWKIKPALALLVFACALSGVISAGIFFGKTYSFDPGTSHALTIDESSIENISYYVSMTSE